MPDRVPYREGISLQPTALRAGLDALPAQLDSADLTPLVNGTIALVGIGASLYAAMAGAAHLRQHGRRAFALAATDLCEPSVDAADAYVALSASGRSVEPVKAMEVRPDAPSFGIASRAGTPLARVVRTSLSTESGLDGSPNTTSYTGSLLALGLLADRIAPAPSVMEWARLPGLVAELLESLRPQVARAAALLRGRVAIDCVASGAASGAAGYASLLLREAVRVAAQPWDTLNFLHGPMEPNDARSGVILYGGAREAQVAQDLAGFGIPVAMITEGSTVADSVNLVVLRTPAVSPGLPETIVQAVPTQLLVGDMMEAAGLPKCDFRYRRSDTKLPP